MLTAIETIRQSVTGELDSVKELTDERVIESIESHTFEYCEKEGLGIDSIEMFVRELRNDMLGFSVLQPLFDDDSITEIMVNKGKVFYEKAGRIYTSGIKINEPEQLMKIIRSICRKAGRTVNAASPITDACLDDGTRINIVLKPVSVDGHCITIRKFPKVPINRNKMIGTGFVSEEAMLFLEDTYCARYNMFICGGAGTGKTTLLNVLANCTSKRERLVTIEDSAELRIDSVENLVRLETRTAGVSGKSISIRDLIRASLRMRPDRIIVGEVRGGEALDMLQAMNTGHEGSVSTGHANSGAELISRLETMVLMGAEMPIQAVRSQIINAIDIIVCLARNKKCRFVTQICEIVKKSGDKAEMNILFDYDYKTNKLHKKNRLMNRDKLERMQYD